MLSFEDENDAISFSKYDTLNTEIKYFNVLIDGESSFDTPVKAKKMHTKRLLKWELFGLRMLFKAL